ncbi:MAG: hypothetical protein GXP25_07605 [Planctomycetes bacterium]|nr:hypothetical protein [Planctomycetota bacterium]
MDVEEIAHNKKGKTEVVLANIGSIRTTITADIPGEYDLCIHGRGSAARDEWPILLVTRDGKEIGQVTLDSPSTAPFGLPVTLTQGEHALEMRFTNDFCDPGKADRNAFVDKVEIWPKQ